MTSLEELCPEYCAQRIELMCKTVLFITHKRMSTALVQRMHVHTHAHMHACTHTHTHIHTHKHTHTHTHTTDSVALTCRTADDTSLRAYSSCSPRLAVPNVRVPRAHRCWTSRISTRIDLSPPSGCQMNLANKCLRTNTPSWTGSLATI